MRHSSVALSRQYRLLVGVKRDPLPSRQQCGACAARNCGRCGTAVVQAWLQLTRQCQRYTILCALAEGDYRNILLLHKSMRSAVVHTEDAFRISLCLTLSDMPDCPGRVQQLSSSCLQRLNDMQTGRIE